MKLSFHALFASTVTLINILLDPEKMVKPSANVTLSCSVGIVAHPRLTINSHPFRRALHSNRSTTGGNEFVRPIQKLRGVVNAGSGGGTVSRNLMALRRMAATFLSTSSGVSAVLRWKNTQSMSSRYWRTFPPLTIPSLINQRLKLIDISDSG